MNQTIKTEEESRTPSDELFKRFQCVHQQEYEPIARNMEDSQNSLMRSLAEYESKKFSEKADLASIHFSNKSSQYRKTFYVFLRLVKSYEEDVKKYGGYFQKCLNIKTRMVLEPREISDLFERRLFKFGKNQNRIPKFWSDDETLLLLTFIACFCAIYLEDFLNLKDHVWRSLATIYPGRDADELKWKWDSIIRIPLHKVPWSTSEDQLLRDLIPIVGPIKWHQIALELCFKSEGKFVRNSNDCWNRWTNYLDPSSSKKIWTNQEEMTMLKALLEGERNWAEIAKRLQGKTEKRTRNRWIRLLKKYRTEIEAEARKLEIFVTRGEVWEQYLIKKLIEIKQNSVSESTLEDISAEEDESDKGIDELNPFTLAMSGVEEDSFNMARMSDSLRVMESENMSLESPIGEVAFSERIKNDFIDQQMVSETQRMDIDLDSSAGLFSQKDARVEL